LFDIWKTTTV